jgi:hypothetical protein
MRLLFHSSDDDILPAVFVRSHHFKPTPGSVVAVTAIAFVFSDKAELTDVVLENGLTVRRIMLVVAQHCKHNLTCCFAVLMIAVRCDPVRSADHHEHSR